MLHEQVSVYFLSSLVLSIDIVIIVGEFNTYVDIDNDTFSTAAISLLYSIGFTHSINTPLHTVLTTP